MAAEPEKKIDELLRAYARKRREDAGEPLEVHPATRRILQGEVTKLRGGKARESRSWWQSLLLVWPRFAAAFAIFMMLALGVWVFVQNERRQPQAVTDMAARGTAPAEQPVLEESIQLKQKNKAELDSLSTALGREEASDSKKLAEKMPAQVLAFDASAKVQLRDAEKPASAPALTGPAAEAGKSVTLKLEPPAQQPVKAGETLLSVAPTDKRSDLDGSARLAKQVSPDNNFRYFRQPDSSGVKSDWRKYRKLLSGETCFVTAGVSLAPNQPTEAYFQNFAYADTNVGLTPLFAGVAVNGQSTNAGATPLGDSYSILPAQSLAVATTEWAATTDRQSLVENEAIRSRALNRTQEFERRDANGPAILQRFAVEQINDQIRIRDGDGSVYEGKIVAATDPSGEVLKEAKDELRENRGVQLRRRLNEAAEPIMPIHFRASGTNKARQLVVINGEMWGEEQLVRLGQVANAPAAPAPKRAPAPTTAAPRPSQPAAASTATGQAGAVGGRTYSGTSSRSITSSVTNAAFKPTTIRARVQIGRTNEIELNAVRMK